MKEIKLLITGSRMCGRSDYSALEDYIDRYVCAEYNIVEILHGDAKGADQLAQEYALKYDIPTRIIKPDYNKYPPKQAPLIRNKELVDLCDYCIAMYKYEVKGGTAYTARYASDSGKLLGSIYQDFPRQTFVNDNVKF